MTGAIHREQERAVLQYLDAVDAVDFDMIAQLWDQANTDAELVNAFHELSEGLLEELEREADWQADAQRVRELLQTHLPSAFPSNEAVAPLTVAEIAARLQADAVLGAGFNEADRAVNAQLLTNRTPLPVKLSLVQLERWTAELGVAASSNYWRAFRQAAVLLSMGRCQRVGELAAARPGTLTTEPPRRNETENREPNTENEA